MVDSDKTVPDEDPGMSRDDVDCTTDFDFSVDEAYDTQGDASEITRVSDEHDELKLPEQVGRYSLGQVLGRGAFGAVVLGRDTQLNRDVAVKLPHLGEADSKWDIEGEFLQEARQLAQVTHPDIVSVFDVGVDEGVCFIVSDYLAGKNLKQWLHTNKPSWQESARIVAAVADALAAAHAAHTVHRDVKPANIILNERAEGHVPILVDFGLALSQETKLRRGKVSGTPSYMSPEQVRGQADQIDGRTDIYSLGVVFYSMLSGELPFASDNVKELLRRVLVDDVRPPRQFVHSIPREVERICMKAMSRSAVDRYNTAGDFAAELRAAIKQEQSQAQSLTAPAPAADSGRARESVRILVADDHELTRFKLQTDLELMVKLTFTNRRM